MKKILCVVSQPPYRNTHSLELLEAAMVAAVFDFQVSVLFRDAGVLALVNDQEGYPLGLRTMSRVLIALPTYEIKSVYACAPSLARYAVEDIDLGATSPIDLVAQSALIANQDVVIGAQA